MIYILKHPKSDFTGISFGVGFDNGRGSTSSKYDRDRLVKAGCKDLTKKAAAAAEASKKKAAKKEKEKAEETEEKTEEEAPEEAEKSEK